MYSHRILRYFKLIFVSVTSNYILIFYNILIFIMYKTRMNMFIVTIKLMILKKSLHITLKKIIGEMK